jgi:carboxyl-terminal processing protease
MTNEQIEIIKLNKRQKELKKNMIFICVISSLITCGVGVGLGSLINKRSKNMNEFLKFYDYFSSHFYQDVDERTLLDGLYYGLTSSVDDDFTFYTSTVNNESQNLSSSGTGIGISRAVYYGNVLIKDVFAYSPAAKATIYDENNQKLSLVGLQEGDIITKINQYDGVNDYIFKEHNSNEWSSYFTGDEGSVLKVTFIRGDQTYCAEITRGEYYVDKVKLLDYDLTSAYKYALVEVSSFLGTGKESTPSSELYNYFTNVVFKDNSYIDNLIIDLRNNGGGYVSNFQSLLGLFIGNSKTAGYYLYNDGTTNRLPSVNNYKEAFDSRIGHYTLIVNENTASAAESFVIGLQDSEITKNKVSVVGETSYGKGIAQGFYDVVFDGDKDGSQVRYTFAKVCSPSKRCINKRGIVPDVMSTYRSIDDEDYDYYREIIDADHELTNKEKAIVLSRIEILLGNKYSSLEEGIVAYQKNQSLVTDGTYNDEVASSLQDEFFTYYHDNTPLNIYESFVVGSSSYDTYYPTQMKCIKNQISYLLNRNFTSYSAAVAAFQEANALDDKNGLYDLETSYLLQGKMYDVRMELENSVLEEAKASYGR